MSDVLNGTVCSLVQLAPPSHDRATDAAWASGLYASTPTSTFRTCGNDVGKEKFLREIASPTALLTAY